MSHRRAGVDRVSHRRAGVDRVSDRSAGWIGCQIEELG